MTVEPSRKRRIEQTGLPEAGRALLRYLSMPRVWVAIAILALLAILFISPLGDRFHHERLVSDLEMLGMWAPALFVLGHVIATSLGVPGTVLTVAGGAVFGLVGGTIWSVLGATLGSSSAFLLARYFFHDWAVKRYGKHPLLVRLNKSIDRHCLKLVLAVRLFPISPFNLVNFLFGLTKAPLDEYALGTAIGIIPGTVLYTWIGATGRQMLEGGDSFPFGIAIAVLTLLSVLPIFIKRWH